MTDSEARTLRDDTVDLFYHGYDNYMEHAFPEDELRPLSCTPLTRDRENEGHFELNDVLGNFTLTLVDSLSTLAIFASTQPELRNGRRPLKDFQNGVKDIVDLYGDGTAGASGQGTRARGFDLDSKVQVFETVIRGVGGLLSAHLFSVGDLPIRGYSPESRNGAIKWPNGFTYDGQLLRLATDLATRLLPAFYTATGLPYPRVNLRHGVPFYINSPLNIDAENGQCFLENNEKREITETCSAGAGSLVMEMSLLSRLTGDMRFEQLARTAFDAVWSRRSDVGLIGAGIDAETGEWVTPFTGIGAGVDSFFEYAMKAHVLFSPAESHVVGNQTSLGQYYLSVWQTAHESNRHHLMRGPAFQHPHYVQGDLYTGAARAFWLDSLSAYYPGLLALDGKIDEAIDMHLLYAALWTRYASLPERWNAAGGSIDSGLRWWGGRPEFVESTWYLYRATKDSWYLRIGEMVLRDIQKRCWTACGWAGLEDVRTGELKDRMESFFLGETAKYLFLLFDSDHPLNTIESPWVMNTEGHPLILPGSSKHIPATTLVPGLNPATAEQCQAVPTTSSLVDSLVASRPNFFHAASLARLHFTPTYNWPLNASLESSHMDPKYNVSTRISRNKHAFYPWTLPEANIPYNGMSAKMETRLTFDVTFPSLPNAVNGVLTAKRIPEGIFVHSVSGLKLSMIKEPQAVEESDGRVTVQNVYRIHAVSHLALGREERVVMGAEAIGTLNPVDPYFTRHRDTTSLDIVLDVNEPAPTPTLEQARPAHIDTPSYENTATVPNGTMISSMLAQLNAAFQSSLTINDVVASSNVVQQSLSERPTLHASVATGAGAGPVPDTPDASVSGNTSLTWNTIYITGQSCDWKLSSDIPKSHQVIVFKRGGCPFSQKLRSIPSFPPSPSSLQLVIMFSDLREDHEGGLIRPLLDEMQTTPGGVIRPNPVPVVMVEGDDTTLELLQRARGVGVRRRYYFSCQDYRIGNLIVI